MRKHQTSPNSGDFYEMPVRYSSAVRKEVMENKDRLRSCYSQRGSGDMMTKCSAVSRIGSWNRKRVLGGGGKIPMKPGV